MGGEWLMALPGHFTPGIETRHTLYRKVGGPQGPSARVRKISPPPGFNRRTVQPVASRYTDWAIPTHVSMRSVHCKTKKCTQAYIFLHHSQAQVYDVRQHISAYTFQPSSELTVFRNHKMNHTIHSIQNWGWDLHPLQKKSIIKSMMESYSKEVLARDKIFNLKP